MKVQCLGAARTVTGSCFVVETGGHRFAVDCGLHQGGSEMERRNRQTVLYRPSELEFIIVTHAHMDHSGLLPRIVAGGFNGPIYATPPTVDLLKIMLLDSAHIQEIEAQWRNHKRLRHVDKKIEPLYTQRDAERTFPLLKEWPYEKDLSPCPGVTVRLRDAGHILGAALVEMWTEEEGTTTKTVFSGDIG
ncbi:MAG: MBL fold metallo-hydrolase, partial [Syntrophales bacterium]|nr:MBL fold metallo-hydrolase [Syntrophales bacterium]